MIAAKNEALQALTGDMKAGLRYAETTGNYDGDQHDPTGISGAADPETAISITEALPNHIEQIEHLAEPVQPR